MPRQTNRDLLVEPNYASLVFSNQMEKHQFDYWMSFTKTTLLFRSDLLTSVIPQLSWNDPAMKHAALAIGAAALGSKTREQRLLGKGQFFSDALQHYGKALSLLYSSPMSEERSLLACLLFITFESLRGNRAAGLTHMNHGALILDQHLPQGKVPSPLLSELMNSFQHFGLQAWSHSGAHPPETQGRVPWCCRGRKKRYAADEMPATFGSMEDAQRWWDDVRHFVQHHAPLKTSFEVASLTPEPTAAARLNGYGSPEFQKRIRSFVRYIDAWHAAFVPIAAKAEREKEKNTQDYIRALGLRIGYLYIWSGLCSGGWANLEDVGRMAPTFRDITSLSRQYLELQGRASDGQEMFTLEDSPTWALALSYVMCNAHDVKKEALSLLKDFPRRDGLWDTRVFVLMLEWMDEQSAAKFHPEDKRHVLGSKVIFYHHFAVLERTRWIPETSTFRTFSIKFNFV